MSRTSTRKPRINVHTDSAIIVSAFVRSGDAHYSLWNGMDSLALTGPAGMARSLLPTAMVVRATKR